jgi:hypothetical protein
MLQFLSDFYYTGESYMQVIVIPYNSIHALSIIAQKNDDIAFYPNYTNELMAFRPFT